MLTLRDRCVDKTFHEGVIKIFIIYKNNFFLYLLGYTTTKYTINNLDTVSFKVHQICFVR